MLVDCIRGLPQTNTGAQGTFIFCSFGQVGSFPVNSDPTVTIEMRVLRTTIQNPRNDGSAQVLAGKQRQEKKGILSRLVTLKIKSLPQVKIAPLVFKIRYVHKKLIFSIDPCHCSKAPRLEPQTFVATALAIKQKRKIQVQ